MKKSVFKNSFLRIILPAICSILLFCSVIFIIVIPTIKSSIITKKREKIKELTNVAWNTLVQIEKQAQISGQSKNKAQQYAKEHIRKLLYGKEMKDYFWINDMKPVMIMHPYRSDLEGQDLSNYKDPQGKKLFVEFVKTVQKNGEGYVDYVWQWKDDPTRMVPKLSFVKGFKPWNWIIGTGIYIEDVRKEISIMTQRLLFISIGILIIISLLIISIIYQLLKSESAQRLLQNKLIHSEKLSAVGQLTAGIAHEFNNLLMIVNGYVEYYIPKTEKNTELFRILTIIEKQTIRGADIVNNMLAFARPKNPQKEIGYIQDIIEEVIKLQTNQLELEHIKIKKEYSTYHKLNFDKNQMQQVFLNLFLNARHAIKPLGKGMIHIVIEKNDELLEIHFSDTGIGMDRETRKNIFNPFFTTKGAWSKDTLGIDGTGLGLSVTYTIIEKHNGTIIVESHKGKGTKFIIQLPLTKKKHTKIKETEKHLPVLEKKKIKKLSILIVDDEKDITTLMLEILKDFGVKKIKTANSGKEAIKIFDENHFDIIFLDIFMPDMNGKIIFNKMKDIDPNVNVVFMAGQIGLAEDAYHPKEIYSYLQKPFSIKKVYTILNKLAQEKSLS